MRRIAYIFTLSILCCAAASAQQKQPDFVRGQSARPPWLRDPSLVEQEKVIAVGQRSTELSMSAREAILRAPNRTLRNRLAAVADALDQMTTYRDPDAVEVCAEALVRDEAAIRQLIAQVPPPPTQAQSAQGVVRDLNDALEGRKDPPPEE